LAPSDELSSHSLDPDLDDDAVMLERQESTSIDSNPRPTTSSSQPPRYLLLPLCFALQSCIIVGAKANAAKLIPIIQSTAITNKPDYLIDDLPLEVKKRHSLPYTAIMEIHRRLSPPKQAAAKIEAVYAEMEQSGVIPDDVVYYQLLQAHLASNDLIKFRESIQKARTSGIEIDQSLPIQTVLLIYWLRMGHPENCTAVLERILSMNLRSVDYSHLRRATKAALTEFKFSELLVMLAKLVLVRMSNI